jgi:membrane protease subunit (stomatin/prohibitin family)
MAMEKASEAESGSGPGMGMGMGLMMPAMFSQYFAAAKPSDQSAEAAATTQCPDCQLALPTTSKFCPHCGHQQVIFQQCSGCGKNLTPNAKFCSRCGQSVEDKPKSNFCPKCSSESLPGALYCNQCGEKH